MSMTIATRTSKGEEPGVRATEMSAVRGAVIIAGRSVLRRHDHFARYLERLSPADRIVLDAVNAAEWVPMSTVHVHERVLDDMRFDRDEARRIGLEISEIVNGLLYTTVASLAGRIGLSPWLVFGQAQRMWDRSYLGGRMDVSRLAESCAQISVTGDPLACYSLHREALGGALLHVVGRFRKDGRLTAIPARHSATTFAFSIRWHL
jgi:hypothetical protein